MSDTLSLNFRPFHAVIVTLFLLAIQSLAFMPTDNKEFAFGDGGISHQSQTREAYKQLI